MKKTIGIDVGDTFFRVAYLDGTTPRLIPDELGRTAFPSKVAFRPGGLLQDGCYVGFDAEMFGVRENTVLHPMTMAGLSWLELERLNEQYAYQFFMEGGQIFIDAHRVFPPVKDVLIALFLYAKRLAEAYLGSPVEGVVIAIPDGSNDVKRILIQEAARAAELKVKQLLNQTTAAALGYRFDRGKNRTIAVIDVGASHTSMSLVVGGRGNLDTIETRHSQVGTNRLLDRLLQIMEQTCMRRTGVSLLSSGSSFIRHEARAEADFALVELSGNETTTVSLGGVGPGGSRIVLDVSRSDFERMIEPELREIQDTIRSPLAHPVECVLLIGGGANIPSVQRTIEMVYRKSPFSSARINPSDAVALGAAIKGGILDGIVHSQITERTVHDLGTFHGQDLMDVLIPRRTPLPHQSSREYRFRGEPPIEYMEKVYQWTGNENGQDKPERDRGIVVLARKRFRLSGNTVRVTFTIDESGIAKFEVTDLVTNKRLPAITGFEIP